MKLAILAFYSLVALPSAKASTEADLAPFLGSYRVLSYNGVENSYSRKFFLPSVGIEPSNKLRQADGSAVRVLHFSFEVPLEISEDEIFLKFLFTQAPLDGAQLQVSERMASLEFSGQIQELVQREWVTCKVDYQLEMQLVDSNQLSIKMQKKAEAPCTNESHAIRAEKAL